MKIYIAQADDQPSKYLAHHGVKGMEKGKRRYQYEDGTYTPLGRIHYGIGQARDKANAKYVDSKGKLNEAGKIKYTYSNGFVQKMSVAGRIRFGNKFADKFNSEQKKKYAYRETDKWKQQQNAEFHKEMQKEYEEEKQGRKELREESKRLKQEAKEERKRLKQESKKDLKEAADLIKQIKRAEKDEEKSLKQKEKEKTKSLEKEFGDPKNDVESDEWYDKIDSAVNQWREEEAAKQFDDGVHRIFDAQRRFVKTIDPDYESWGGDSSHFEKYGSYLDAKGKVHQINQQTMSKLHAVESILDKFEHDRTTLQNTFKYTKNSKSTKDQYNKELTKLNQQLMRETMAVVDTIPSGSQDVALAYIYQLFGYDL